jgi:MYXO-CTERM domain-containing protein
MKRLTASLAIVVGLLIGGFATASALGATVPSKAAVQTTTSVHVTPWGGNGSGNLPCTGGTLHWIFTGGDQGSYADLYINGVLADGGDQAGPTPGNGAWHFFTPSAGVTTTTPVEVRYDGAQRGVLTISHCEGGTTTSTTTSTVPTTSTTTIPTITTDTAPTTSTTTIPTITTDTAPTTSTSSTAPTTSTTTIPTITTNTVPTTSTSTIPSTSTTTQPSESTLPSESTRPSEAVPTAVDAGISGPTGGSGQPPMMSFVGIFGGLAMAAAGAFALLRRRGQHEA